MNIALATPHDASGIANVHVYSWQAAYAGILSAAFLESLSIDRRTSQWQEILQRQESKTLVAKDAAGVAGFVSFGHWRDQVDAIDHGEI